jgi:hypothetical protein
LSLGRQQRMKYPVLNFCLQRWLRIVPYLFVLLVGCSGGCKGSPSAVVKGVVKFNGAPLPGGNVTFSPESNPGQASSSIIETNGSYRLLNPPKGAVIVTVMGPGPSSDSNDQNKPAVVLPSKYQDPRTSGLIYTVKDGSQPTFRVRASGISSELFLSPDDRKYRCLPWQAGAIPRRTWFLARRVVL